MVWESLIDEMISLICAMAATAAAVSAWMVSMRRPMSSVARPVSWASSLTSPATTAKPRPASPARAASMVALSARRLVCWAIDVMTRMTLLISADDSPSLVTVLVGGLRRGDRAGGHTGRVGGAAGDLADRRGHLLGADGGRLDVLQTCSAAAETRLACAADSCAEPVIVVRYGGQLLRGRCQRLRVVPHGGHGLPELGERAVERARHLPDLVLAPDVQLDVQPAVGDGVQHLDRELQGTAPAGA